jgi:hypothetical protein
LKSFRKVQNEIGREILNLEIATSTNSIASQFKNAARLDLQLASDREKLVPESGFLAADAPKVLWR